MNRPEPAAPSRLLTRIEDVPDAAREHHRWLSNTDWAFRKAAFERPELRDPSRFTDLHPFVLGDLGFDNHSWPMFLDRSRWQAWERDAVGITRLLLDTPRRVVGTGAAMAELYGVYPAQIYDILLAEPSGVRTAVARGDFLVEDRQLRIIELNASPNSGGWEMGELAERYLAHPLLRSFLDERDARVEDLDPVRNLLRHLLEAGRGHLTDGSAEVSGRFDLAMVHGAAPSFPADHPFAQRVREIYRRIVGEAGFEGELHMAPVSALTLVGGHVEIDGRRVHGLLEDKVRVPPPVYRAFKAGKLALFNGPLEPVLSDKRNLALLSEHAETHPGSYDEEERDLVARVLPWTRVVRPGRVRYRDAEAEMADLAVADRDRWVLKPCLESGGRGVTFGSETDPDRWRETLDQALAAGDWVIQERGEIQPYIGLEILPDGSGAPTLHDTILGLMVYGDRLGGGVIRYQPRALGGAVNAAGGATPGSFLILS